MEVLVGESSNSQVLEKYRKKGEAAAIANLKGSEKTLCSSGAGNKWHTSGQLAGEIQLEPAGGVSKLCYIAFSRTYES